MIQPTSVQVIRRAGDLLDALVNAGGSAPLAALARATGLHPSTAHRILGALVQVDLVEHPAGSRYALGVKLRRLAAAIPAEGDLRDRARTIMEELRDQTGETVNLTVREGDEVVYIERALARRIMRVEQIIGSRAPLHVTAVGKVMLGDLGDRFVRDYAQRTGLPRFTERTITTGAALTTETGRASALGYALDDEEAEEGVGCIGAPIRDATGRVVAGLSLSAPRERRRVEWIPLVQQAAARVSARLGYAPPAPAR